MKYKFTTVLLIFAIAFSGKMYAKGDSLQHAPGQVTFVYPLGTSGPASSDYDYNFSFNILLGVTGGIHGIECAGIMNTVKNDVHGVQGAGIMNITNGNFYGAQRAGVMNTVNKDFVGAQQSGVISICNRNFIGAQSSGVISITNGSLNGVQGAGIANIVNDEMLGIQGAGIANIVNKSMRGVQAAGIANISNGDFAGLQAAGIINISNGNIKGLQAAGIVNKANILNGVQIGLINICDSVESGVPIGLVNIIKKGGYFEWDLSFADYANTAISLKTGVKDFYAIYTLGANYNIGKAVVQDKLWFTGFGVGHIFEISDNFWIQPELMGISYNVRHLDRHEFSGSTHLKLGLTYNFTKHFGISLAPSVYANFSNPDEEPYTLSQIKPIKTYLYDEVRLEVGYGLGLALQFH